MRHAPRKRFGQNFLTDRGVIDAILAAIAAQPGDNLVEIGPGLGALTRPLLQQMPRLQVVEIDRDLVARMRQEFPPDRLIIHQGDARTFDFGGLGQDLRVIGNLPYNISTPLLFHLAEFAAQVRDMHFMLQKEVVERMVAEAGGADYGRLSVMLQYRFHLEQLFIVPPEAFEPAPKVESAFVRMQPRAARELEARDEQLFSRVVAQAFSQRRKMLRNTLRALLTEDDFTALGIVSTRRAEELAVGDYVRITAHLANSLSEGN